MDPKEGQPYRTTKLFSPSPDTYTIKQDGNEGIVEAVFSTFGVIDRDGDMVKAGAIPEVEIPIAWGHDWRRPVGRGAIATTRKNAKIEGRFFMDTEGGREAFNTVKAMGDLQQWSWGFEVKEWEFGEVDGKEGVRIIKDTEPFEVSPVLVGSNRDTRTVSVKDGEVPVGWTELIFDHTRRVFVPDAADVEVVKGILFDGWDFKRAIPAHRTATSDAAWSGPANEASLPSEARRLRRAFAWIDEDGDADTKAAYRFIHHFTNSGAASLVASSTGIAVLNGARGGTTIPDADRRGVWRHLAAHLRAGDREPPELRGYEPPTIQAASEIEYWLNGELSAAELRAAGFTVGREQWEEEADLALASAKYSRE